MTTEKYPFIFISITLLFILTVGITMQPYSDVYIKEVCPHNQTIMYDTVGEYSDYIILSNSSGTPVSLKNYGLSDDPDNLGKYTLPDIKLPPGETVTVWAATPAFYNEYLIQNTDLYTRFSLRDGESLFLTDPYGIIIDKLALGESGSDYRFVKAADLSKWNVVSPDVSSSINDPEKDVPDPPFFSSPSGLYTTDGSDPRVKGIPYESPIRIADRSSLPNLYAGIKDISVYDTAYIPYFPVDKANVIRAVSCDSNGLYSDVKSVVFWVGKNIRERYSKTYTVSLTADPSDLFSDESGIYVNGKIWKLHKDNEDIIDKMKYNIDGFEPTFLPVNYNKRGTGWSRPADITLFDNKGNLIDNISGQIKIHGNYSRLETQKSFTLYPSTDSQLPSSLSFSGDSLIIRKGGDDESGLKDDLCSQLVENLDLQACSHIRCNLFINGEYWGCYNLTERIDESYIADRFDVDQDNIILVKNWGLDSEIANDPVLFDSLKELIKESDLTLSENYEQVCRKIDMDNLIDYYCAEIYLNNMDFIWNNVAMWRVRNEGSGKYEDGKWRFLFYDLDDTCSSPEDDTLEELLTSDNPQFFASLFHNEQFRSVFRKRFYELEKNVFSPDNVQPLLNQMENEYSDSMVLSNRRFLVSDYNTSDYHALINGMRDFFNKRSVFINEYLESYLSSASYP